MDFIKLVNREHEYQRLSEEAAEHSQLAKVKTENRRIMRINATLIKVGAALGSVAIIAIIIK